MPTSAPWATSSSVTGSSGDSGAPAGLELADEHRAHPLEDAQEADAGPVGGHPLDHDPRARARAPRRRRGRRPRTGRRGRAGRAARARPAGRPRSARPRASTVTPQRSSSRSVWSRLGSGSITAVSPPASRPASSTHDLICAEATGSAYSIPCSGEPADRERGEAVLAGVDPRAHRAAAARRSGRRGGGGSTRRRRASSSRRAGRPASPGSSRISVPALPTSITPAAGAAARSPVPRIVRIPSRARARRARRAPARPRASSWCRRRRGSRSRAPGRRSSRPAARRGARATCRPGAASVPAQRAGGVEAAPHRATSARRSRRRRPGAARRTARPSRPWASRPAQPSTGSSRQSGSRQRAASTASSHSQAERPTRPGGVLVAERGAQDAQARDQLVDAGQAGVAVGGEDLGPQRRRRRAPRASCRGRRCRRARPAGRRSAASPASACAARCGTWLVRATAASCSSGVQATSRPPSASTAAASASSGSSAVARRAGGPRRAAAAAPAVEAAQPAVSAPAIGCAPTSRSCARQLALHRGGVGDERAGQRVEHLLDHVGGARRRHGDEHELAARERRRASRRPRSPRRRRPRARRGRRRSPRRRARAAASRRSARVRRRRPSRLDLLQHPLVARDGLRRLGGPGAWPRRAGSSGKEPRKRVSPGKRSRPSTASRTWASATWPSHSIRKRYSPSSARVGRDSIVVRLIPRTENSCSSRTSEPGSSRRGVTTKNERSRPVGAGQRERRTTKRVDGAGLVLQPLALDAQAVDRRGGDRRQRADARRRARRARARRRRCWPPRPPRAGARAGSARTGRARTGGWRRRAAAPRRRPRAAARTRRAAPARPRARPRAMRRISSRFSATEPSSEFSNATTPPSTAPGGDRAHDVDRRRGRAQLVAVAREVERRLVRERALGTEVCERAHLGRRRGEHLAGHRGRLLQARDVLVEPVRVELLRAVADRLLGLRGAPRR